MKIFSLTFILIALIFFLSCSPSGDSSPSYNDPTPTPSYEDPSGEHLLSPEEWRIVYIAVGDTNSIAVDSSGDPAIAFYDRGSGAHGEVNYFYSDGAEWLTESTNAIGSYRLWQGLSIALGSDDQPHIAFDVNSQSAHSHRIIYTTKVDETWTTSRMFGGWGGWSVSTTTDSVGTLHAVYWNNTVRDIYYYTSSLPGTVLREMAADTSMSYVNPLAIAVDEFDIPHIIYRNSLDIEYAYRSEDGWVAEVIDTGWESASLSNRSIAAVGDDIHVIYGINVPDEDAYELRHASKIESDDWVIEIIAESETSNFLYPGIAADEDGGVHVVYIYNAELIYAYFDGIEWQTTSIDTAPASAINRFSIAADEEGFPHISYVSRLGGENYVRYATPYNDIYSNPPVDSHIAVSECRDGNIVNLSIECSGAREMLLSESSDFSGANWESCWHFRPFPISSGYEDKTIYAKFRGDDFDFESDVVTATSIFCGPAAIIEDNSHFAMLGEEVHFVGRGHVAEGEIVAYEWLLDGEVVENLPEFISDSIEIGIHTVQLRVQADTGEWSPLTSVTLIVASNDVQLPRTGDAYQYIYDRMDRYEDDISVPHLIESYATPYAPSTSGQAFVYDNALVVGALLARGEVEDIQRARAIVAKLVELHHRDNPLREAYSASTHSRVRSTVYTGNLAWTIISMMQYYKYSGDTDTEFLEEVKDAAIDIGERIEERCRNSEIGYTGYSNTAKSSEHNIDLYVAFELIASEVAEADVWHERAEWAKSFVESMWTGSYFMTGSTVTIGMEDVHSWAILAIDDLSERDAALKWLEDNCATYDETPAGSTGFVGFDYNTDNDGVWFEGTAHVTLAYQVSDQMRSQEILLNELRRAQVEAENADGRSIVAASNWGVSTGLGWEYFSSPHIGATAWYLAAEQQYNMFWGIPTLDEDGDGVSDVRDSCPGEPDDRIGDPCIHDDCEDFTEQDDVGEPCIHNDCADFSLEDGTGDPCIHNDCADLSPEDDVGNPCVHNDCADLSLEDLVGDTCIHNDCADLSLEDDIGDPCIHNDCADSSLEDSVGDPCIHNDCADLSLQDGIGDPCIHNDCSDLSLEDSTGDPCIHNDCTDFSPEDEIGDPCIHNDCADLSLQDGIGDPCIHNDCIDLSLEDEVGNPCIHNDCADLTLEDDIGDPCIHNDCADLSLEDDIGDSCIHNDCADLSPEDAVGDPCIHNDCADLTLEDGVGDLCIHNDCADLTLEDSVGDPCIHNDCSDFSLHDSVGNPCAHNDCADLSLQDDVGNSCIHNDCADFTLEDEVGDPCIHNDCADFSLEDSIGDSCIHNDCADLTLEDAIGDPCIHNDCADLSSEDDIGDPCIHNDCADFSLEDEVGDPCNHDDTSRPDLVISDAEVVTARARSARIRVTVENAGTAPAEGVFYIGTRPNWYTKPGWNSSSFFLWHGESLAPGESMEKVIYRPDADSWLMMIDFNDRVDEVNEDNNTYELIR